MFLEALTPWPETGRAAAALLTGVDPSRSTRGEPARLIEGATLAARLREHGYRTLAAVSHPALAAELGFGSGFDEFREYWGDAATGTDAVRDFGLGTLGTTTEDAPCSFGSTSPRPPARISRRKRI